jgi:hypothetical protein
MTSDFVDNDAAFQDILQGFARQEEEMVEALRLSTEEAILKEARLASIESARLDKEMEEAIMLSIEQEQVRLISCDSDNIMSYENIAKSLARDICSYPLLKKRFALDNGQSFTYNGKTFTEQCGLIAFLQGVLLAFGDSPNKVNLPYDFISLVEYYKDNGRDNTLYYLYNIIDHVDKRYGERVSTIDLETLALLYNVRLEIITGGDDESKIVGDEDHPYICLANIGNHYVVNIGDRQSVPLDGDVISFKQIFQNLGITKNDINELIVKGIIEKYDPIFDEVIQRDILDIAAECGATDGSMTDEQCNRFMSLISSSY